MTSTETIGTAANPLQIGTRDKSVGWYTPTLENVSEVQRDLLENYSHITPDRVVPHILEVRDKAWEIHPYPCIGQLRFIDLTISRSPSYSLVLERLKKGASLLDLGCCFAQDLRKLVHDGAPSENLWGAELKGDFLELGYELFLDRESFKAHFMEADVFDMEGPLKQLEGKMDLVQIGLFLHLFDLEGQNKACDRVVGLLKPEKGVFILGQQIGSLEAGPMALGSGSKMYKHNVESFEKMWRDVGERTGTEWRVTANMDAGLGIDQKKRTWDDPNTRRLVFEIERVG
ncbi:Methyltransferase ausD [Lachnellula suecica]|uniref:Methyltransferase ausD n=1 Tax=Lachnellula suecica TaxID=602035 RepID=A0A8T9C9S2_9HELO|nr:Methyltransferase ausD [Lachnellula suecica]